MNKKLLYLNEAGFTKEESKKIRKWLKPWISEFISRSDFAEHNVKVLDSKTGELFFFTTCHDILHDMPEDKAIETNFDIRRRKHNIMMSLFLKQLVNHKIKIVPPECTHCGHSPIDMTHSVNGYHRFCPHCGNIIVDTFISSLAECTYKSSELIKNKYGGKK